MIKKRCGLFVQTHHPIRSEPFRQVERGPLWANVVGTNGGVERRADIVCIINEALYFFHTGYVKRNLFWVAL